MRNNTEKALHHFVDNLISDHAKYDSSNEEYVLDVSKLPDDAREEFSALLIQNHHDYLEALSINNKTFEKYTVTALIRYLKNTSCPDNRFDFLESLRESITDYHADTMQEVINERLAVYSEGGHDIEPVSYNDTWGISYALP